VTGSAAPTGGYPAFCESTYRCGHFLIFCQLNVLSPGSIVMMSDRNLLYLVLVGLFLQGCAGSGLQSQTEHRPLSGAELNEGGSLDTGVLEPTVGHKGDKLGAEVVSSEVFGELQSIEINVPIDPDSVDQVHVLDESGEPLPMSRKATIVHNYETNNVGISIQLPKSEKTGFRLKLIDKPEDGWYRWSDK